MLDLIKITCCRDGQLMWLEGHFEKAAFNGKIDRFIWRYWVQCARYTLQNNRRWGTEKTQRLSTNVPHPKVGSDFFLFYDQIWPLN